jgi:hypothetical protein
MIYLILVASAIAYTTIGSAVATWSANREGKDDIWDAELAPLLGMFWPAVPPAWLVYKILTGPYLMGKAIADQKFPIIPERKQLPEAEEVKQLDTAHETQIEEWDKQFQQQQ